MDIDRRFFDNLMSDRRLSLRQLAKKMGMTHSQLSLTFSGARRMQLDEAAKLAHIFNIPITKIATAAGVADAATAGKRCHVTGIMQGDGSVRKNDAIERTLVPDGLPDGVEAIQARTADSKLAWMDGFVFFYLKDGRPDSTIIGRFCLVDIQDHGLVMATVRRGYSDGCFSLSGPASAEDVKVRSASPILITRH